VTTTQLVFGIALVVLLLGLGGFAGWRQLRLLREVGTADTEEARYLRGRARRRLVCSVLMVVLAGLLAGGLAFLEEPAQRLADEIAGEEAAEARARGELERARKLAGEVAGEEAGEVEGALKDPVKKAFARIYGYYYVGLLLVLLALVCVAGWDYVAVRRYGNEQFRRLQEERRAVINYQLARLRDQDG
jgi:hypothetical protein